MADQIIKCSYSGDKDDEFCAKCDGLTMVMGKETYPATACEGYTMESNPAPVVITPPKATVKPPKAAKPNKLTAAPAVAAVTEQEPVETGDQTSEIGDLDTSPVEAEDYTVQGMTTVIRAESGVTIELKDSRGQTHWYKFAYAEERIVPAGADIASEREALWTDAHRQVDIQEKEIKNLLN